MIRRLDPYYRLVCNGRDAQGCIFTKLADDKREARALAVQHAKEARHEVVVQNINDGLVVDYR